MRTQRGWEEVLQSLSPCDLCKGCQGREGNPRKNGDRTVLPGGVETLVSNTQSFVVYFFPSYFDGCNGTFNYCLMQTKQLRKGWSSELVALWGEPLFFLGCLDMLHTHVLGTWGPAAVLLSPSCSLTWLLSFLISLLRDAYSSREN